MSLVEPGLRLTFVEPIVLPVVLSTQLIVSGMSLSSVELLDDELSLELPLVGVVFCDPFDEFPELSVEPLCDLSDEFCEPSLEPLLFCDEFDELLSDDPLEELLDEFPELSDRLPELSVFSDGVVEPLWELSLELPFDGVVLDDTFPLLSVVDEPELEVSLLLVLELFVGTTGTCSVSPSLMSSAFHVPAD